MAKRPSIQFYPADWRNNAKLRRCSWAARGVWIELIGLLHDSDEYGLLRWPLREIAQALGAPVKEVKELADKNVLYGCESGMCEPMIYTPRSGRVDGEPVVLVPAQPGPIWYSPRMVRDEHVRNRSGGATRFRSREDGADEGQTAADTMPGDNGPQGDSPDLSPSESPNHSPSRRQGESQSDGSTSSSSSSIKAPPKSPRGDQRPRMNLETWMASLPEGVPPIPDDHSVFAYAERVGMPMDFVGLAWEWFKREYRAKPRKVYADWPAHFRNAVEKGWGNLWRISADGEYFLTTAGKQLQRNIDAEQDADEGRAAA